MSRLTVSRHSKQSISSWSGFLRLLAEHPPKATVGYLPPITTPPTENECHLCFYRQGFQNFNGARDGENVY